MAPPPFARINRDAKPVAAESSRARRSSVSVEDAALRQRAMRRSEESRGQSQATLCEFDQPLPCAHRKPPRSAGGVAELHVA